MKPPLLEFGIGIELYIPKPGIGGFKSISSLPGTKPINPIDGSIGPARQESF